MNAQELRIGNYIHGWFNTNEGIEQKAFPISGKVIQEIEEWGVHDYSPIPLTEDWLIRASGKKDQLAPYIDFGYFELTKADNDWYFVEKEGVRLCAIKYVHQLQNLYFALTGKELEIKE